MLRSLFSLLLAGSVSATVQNAIYPGNSTECELPSQWLDQAIDHDNASVGSFKQKYYITTDFYTPGGPVLLFQGEESTLTECLDESIMYSFAQELGGIAVALEHRYFGESLPFGPNEIAYTKAQWDYLTLENVMADAIALIGHIKTTVPGASQAPVFVASGSYGGFLATMFRQNHPETFTGALASAPPLRGFVGGNATESADEFNWWRYLDMIYREQSLDAAMRIERAWTVLRERMAANDSIGLQRDLGLCAAPTMTTLPTLELWLAQVFSFAVEFNYPVAHPGRSPVALPLETVMNIALTEPDPIQILNRTNWMWYPGAAAVVGLPFPCIDIEASNSNVGVPLIATGPFDKLTCAYVPFVTSGLFPNGTIFPAPFPDVRVELLNAHDICVQTWGAGSPSTEELQRKYKYTDEDLRNSTGIIWSVGEWDPTTAGSALFQVGLPVPSTPYGSRVMYTQGMAHREDLWALGPDTRASVRASNAKQLNIFREWMAIHYANLNSTSSALVVNN